MKWNPHIHAIVSRGLWDRRGTWHPIPYVDSRWRPASLDRLVIVDGDADALGGHYYLRRKSVDVDLVPRGELYSWLDSTKPRAPLYVLVSKAPLDGFAAPPGYALSFQGYLNDWPDVKRDTRRYLYRFERERPAS